ncbi:MAG: hypothetical protein Q8R09_00680 [Anaerolineaceae bacterium]|jgi:hypothetical protein|nr:hypothetical protein [Anaerolineaceae bacterium]MDP3720945.1 hypothetical protein [Anaerolineaceae bacterium]
MKPAQYSQIPQTEKPMETFPQPRTIPEAWDMSNMFTSEEAGSDLSSTSNLTEETGSEKWEAH